MKSKKDQQQPYVFKSIAALMRRLNLPAPLHPLVALVNYNNAQIDKAEAGNKWALDFYKISFKNSFSGKVKYGQGYYDFEAGGLAFLGPDQAVTIAADDRGYEGYTLYFHPDLIRNYPLGKSIHQYGFFAYAVNEALFLSEKEKGVIAALFNTIAQELETNIDLYSQDVLVAQIELLLTYSNRYYNRQFITRKVLYNDMVTKMDGYLRERMAGRHTALSGLITVQELADHLNVSPRYLTDMLKSLSGQNAQQYIHQKLIERAKDILVSTTQTVAEVAYELGFEHPQSFTKFFKQKTAMTPVAYRQSVN